MTDINKGYNLLPTYMQGGMRRYIEEGVRPGDFLSAVLSNNFMDAWLRADNTNQKQMRKYAEFLYVYAPPESFGSETNFEAWIMAGGLKGLEGYGKYAEEKETI